MQTFQTPSTVAAAAGASSSADSTNSNSSAAPSPSKISPQDRALALRIFTTALDAGDKTGSEGNEISLSKYAEDESVKRLLRNETIIGVSFIVQLIPHRIPSC